MELCGGLAGRSNTAQQLRAGRKAEVEFEGEVRETVALPKLEVVQNTMVYTSIFRKLP